MPCACPRFHRLFAPILWLLPGRHLSRCLSPCCNLPLPVFYISGWLFPVSIILPRHPSCRFLPCVLPFQNSRFLSHNIPAIPLSRRGVFGSHTSGLLCIPPASRLLCDPSKLPRQQ